jgi:pimeloyl-ACP methyl ester carboxylesterase
MRSLAGDGAYVASVIRQIDGPVILVGHSYGGAVITVAGVEDNVKALVRLPASGHDRHRDRFISPRHALPPQGSRGHHPHRD